jgi:hypothetical protein
VDKPASDAVVRQRSREQLYMEGKAIRDKCPRLSHADWKPPAALSDPIEILEASNKGRFPELIPVRYGRMIPSPSIKDREAQKRLQRRVQKAEASEVREVDFPKLVSVENGEPTIRRRPGKPVSKCKRRTRNLLQDVQK